MSTAAIRVQTESQLKMRWLEMVGLVVVCLLIAATEAAKKWWGLELSSVGLLLTWFIGKMTAQSSTAVTERQLQSLPPERVGAMLQSLPPKRIDAIYQRAMLAAAQSGSVPQSHESNDQGKAQKPQPHHTRRNDRP